MTQEKLEKYLLSKPFTKKEFPFGDDIAVFKVFDKMFALYGFEEDIIRLNLKCEPNDAIFYREIYECVIPGYHMNKKHWNTIILNDTLDDDILKEMIDDSFSLVCAKLQKKYKEQITLANSNS